MKNLKNLLSSILFVGLSVIGTTNLSNASIYDRNGNRIPDIKAESENVNWDILSINKDKHYKKSGFRTTRMQ